MRRDPERGDCAVHSVWAPYCLRWTNCLCRNRANQPHVIDALIHQAAFCRSWCRHRLYSKRESANCVDNLELLRPCSTSHLHEFVGRQRYKNKPVFPAFISSVADNSLMMTPSILDTGQAVSTIWNF